MNLLCKPLGYREGKGRKEVQGRRKAPLVFGLKTAKGFAQALGVYFGVMSVLLALPSSTISPAFVKHLVVCPHVSSQGISRQVTAAPVCSYGLKNL